MPIGTIVGQPQNDGNSITIAVEVNEGANIGRVEYSASVSLSEDLERYGFPGQILGDLTNAEKKEILRLAIKAVRDKQRVSRTNVGGISGTITI